MEEVGVAVKTVTDIITAAVFIILKVVLPERPLSIRKLKAISGMRSYH